MPHTPGPWTMHGPSVSRDPSENGDYAIVANGKIIAEAFRQVGTGEVAPAYSNAVLIAAAPELLAAAKAA